MLAVVDYGRGNLFSISRALSYIGVPHEVTADIDRVRASDQVILPGVGAFGDAMAQLRRRGLAEPVVEVARRGSPLLGICVGCQMLFDRSVEFGEHDGLGLVRGHIEALPRPNSADDTWRVPNVGWRSIDQAGTGGLFADLGNDAMVYFVHSFVPAPTDPIVSATSAFADIKITAAIEQGNLVGMQFHPERSGAVGLELLSRFAAMKGY